MRTLESQGKPVSAALNFIPTEDHLTHMKHALALLDAVHVDGELPIIAVDIHESIDNNQIAAFQVDISSKIPIAIVVRPPFHLRYTTFLHEVGHFIDWSALGDIDSFASQNSNELNSLMGAIVQSQTVQILEKYLHNPFSIDGTKERETDVSDFAAYYLRREELFARAYAQYIAVRSVDTALIREIDEIRQRGAFVSLTQWPQEDFTGIVGEFDKIFLERGWRQ